MHSQEAERSSDAERSGIAGDLHCARCGNAFPPGRANTRFCSDRRRAAAGRDAQARRVRAMKQLIGELAKLADHGEPS